MTTRIQFDIKALEALFPEGSEARLDLQRSIVAALLSKLAISDVQRLSAQQKEEARKVAQEVCTQMGIAVSYYGSVHLDERVKKAIATAIKEEAEKTIREAAREALADVQGNLNVMIQNRVEERINGSVGAVLRNTIREEVRSMLGSLGK